jgi:ATPase subunit of ABC transporter with duplicated ATPase domains
MMEYQGVILFTSHDHALMQSVANRVIEVTPNGVIDKLMSYDDYINNEEIKAQRISKYLIK